MGHAAAAVALTAIGLERTPDAVRMLARERSEGVQLVLGTLGQDQAPFGQGTLVRFRMRAIS
jgi:hypothetical protein